METRSRQTLGTAIFVAGVLLGIVLAALAALGDFEAMSYFYTGAGYAGFSGLKCPALLSQHEVAKISAKLDNPSDETVEPYYQVEISGITGTRKLEKQITLPPRSSQTVQWTVSAADIDLGFLVMVKMDILPDREATCGMVVLNFGGLSGNQIVDGWLALTLIALVVGLVMREAGQEPSGGRDLNLRNGLRAAGVLACVALFASLSGSWLFGVLFIAFTILLLVILLRIAVT